MEYYLLSHPSSEIYDQASKWIVPSTTGYLTEFHLGIWSRHYLSTGKSSMVQARPWYEEHTGYNLAHCVRFSTLVSIFCYRHVFFSNCYCWKWGFATWSQLRSLGHRRWRASRPWWFFPRRVGLTRVPQITNRSLIKSGTFTLNPSAAQNGTLNFTAAFYGTNFEFPSSSLANGNITNATYVHTLFQLVDLVYDELTESAYEFS
jgi:hypothetical protein